MPEEIILSILGFLAFILLFFFPAGTITLFVILFRRTGRLQRRLAKLEVQPVTATVVNAERVESSSVPPIATAPPPSTPARSLGSGVELGVELVLGRRVLGWAAVVMLFFGAAFFLRLMIENQWLGPLGRVTLGVLGGVTLTVCGWWTHRRGQRVVTPMLNSAGVIVLYLSVYSAFGFYHLLPQQYASVFMLAVIVEAALLAGMYNSWSLGLVSLLGGLATPLLMRSEHDQYQAYFLYLAAINFGVALLTLWRPWRAITVVALLGTQVLFWLWYADRYHPEKLYWALGLQAGLYLIHFLHGLAYPREASGRREPLGVPRESPIHRGPGGPRSPAFLPVAWIEFARLLLNATLWFGSAYVLLRPDYRIWMGTFAVGMAAVYVAYGRLLLWRRPDDNGQLFAALAVSVGFIALALPIQARAPWVALGWAAESAVLLWFGLRVRSLPLRLLALPIGALAVIRLLVVDTPRFVREPFVPLFNEYATPALGVVTCVLLAAWLARRFMSRLSDSERIVVGLTAVVGLGLLWFVLTTETRGWFATQAYRSFVSDIPATQPSTAAVHAADYGPGARWQVQERWRWFGQMAVSVLWGMLAIVWLAIGFRTRTALLRWSALTLFAVTTVKVLLWDMAGLREIYRILAFFLVAILLGLAGWAYQRARTDDTSEAVANEVT